MKNWNAAKVFSYKEIKAATNNFKEVIGRGSFGSVYLGKLPDDRQVAVKVRFDKTQLGADSFMNEVSLLSCISHPSLVVLEGFCHESKQQILVYEYLPGGSLTDNLYGAMRKKLTLSWVCRLKIAVDAAKGLDYLHNGSEPKIIHRDVKSSNILLDADMNAKVSDFGLSKRVNQMQLMLALLSKALLAILTPNTIPLNSSQKRVTYTVSESFCLNLFVAEVHVATRGLQIPSI